MGEQYCDFTVWRGGAECPNPVFSLRFTKINSPSSEKREVFGEASIATLMTMTSMSKETAPVGSKISSLEDLKIAYKECKLPICSNCNLFCSLKNPKHQEELLPHSRCSKTLAEWMKTLFSLKKKNVLKKAPLDVNTYLFLMKNTCVLWYLFDSSISLQFFRT